MSINNGLVPASLNNWTKNEDEKNTSKTVVAMYFLPPAITS